MLEASPVAIMIMMIVSHHFVARGTMLVTNPTDTNSGPVTNKDTTIGIICDRIREIGWLVTLALVPRTRAGPGSVAIPVGVVVTGINTMETRLRMVNGAVGAITGRK